VREHRPLVQNKGRPSSHKRTKPVEIRRCPRHGPTEFGFYGAQPHTQKWKCKRCVAEHVTRRHQQLKRTLVREAGGRCCLCGYAASIIALHFHHVDPAEKSFPMSTASGKSIAAYREEARKCVLVCANCHCEIEQGLVESPPAGSTFEDTLSTYGPAGRAELPAWDAEDSTGSQPLELR
jgi:hypothetical protein